MRMVRALFSFYCCHHLPRPWRSSPVAELLRRAYLQIPAQKEKWFPSESQQTIKQGSLVWWFITLVIAPSSAQVTYEILIIKPIRCTNFSNLFWNKTLHVSDNSSVHRQAFFHCTDSNGTCHTGLLAAGEQEHLLLLTSCQQTCMTCTIAVCTVKKRLTMDGGIVRNM